MRNRVMLAALAIRTVIPGHGEPFAGDEVRAALDRAFSRLAHFENDSLRVARHALKVMLMFALLDKQSLGAGLSDHHWMLTRP